MSTKEEQNSGFDTAVTFFGHKNLTETEIRLMRGWLIEHESALQQRIGEQAKLAGDALWENSELKKRIEELEAKCAELEMQSNHFFELADKLPELSEKIQQLEAFKAKVLGSPRLLCAMRKEYGQVASCEKFLHVSLTELENASWIYAVPCADVDAGERKDPGFSALSEEEKESAPD